MSKNDIYNVASTDLEQTPQSDERIIIDDKPVYSFFKRCFDIFAAVVGILVLFVPLCIIALIIVIDSPGSSPIYVQNRVGKNGKEFKFYKFRSMVAKADEKLDDLLDKNEMQGPVFKIKDDPRVTRFGRFIRKVSIDELPQLWNVLKGDMSMVGPRPPLPREVALYNETHKMRLAIIPGITCFWQIQPKRNSLSFEEWFNWDIKYIKERNFKLDIMILIKTVKAVFGAEGE